MFYGVSDVFVGDLPMTRVKMNAKQEYEYLVNFKVLQNAFKAKQIAKVRCSSSSFCPSTPTHSLSCNLSPSQ